MSNLGVSMIWTTGYYNLFCGFRRTPVPIPQASLYDPTHPAKTGKEVAKHLHLPTPSQDKKRPERVWAPRMLGWALALLHSFESLEQHPQFTWEQDGELRTLRHLIPCIYDIGRLHLSKLLSAPVPIPFHVCSVLCTGPKAKPGP